MFEENRNGEKTVSESYGFMRSGNSVAFFEQTDRTFLIEVNPECSLTCGNIKSRFTTGSTLASGRLLKGQDKTFLALLKVPECIDLW